VSKTERSVVFISTKNLDYIRNVQEIEMLKANYDEVLIIGSTSSSYVKRMVVVFGKLFLMSMKKYDEVFIGFAPQLVLPFWGWKFNKQNVTIDFFISVYDTMVQDRKKFKKNSLPARIFHWLDKVTLKKADKVIGDTKAHIAYFADEFGISKDNFEVLYLEADKKIYYPRDIEKPNDLKDKFVVLYFGSILPLQGVEVVTEAVNYLKDETDIYFWIIGPLGEKEKTVDNKNVRLDKWLSQEELADAIGIADLCLAGHFNAEIDKADRTIPGKAYIYDAMDKIIVFGDTSANKELFQEREEKYYFVERGNSVALAETITKIKNQRID